MARSKAHNGELSFVPRGSDDLLSTLGSPEHGTGSDPSFRKRTNGRKENLESERPVRERERERESERERERALQKNEMYP